MTPRRWLWLANPGLAAAISESIGTGWITDFSQISELKAAADDQSVQERILRAKRAAKEDFRRLAAAVKRAER